MTTIFERTVTALGTISPAIVYSMAPYKKAPSGDLPDQYVVYQLVVGNPEQHADDAETLRSYTMQVTIWSRNGLVTVPDVNAAMIAAGFQKGPERPLPQDRETGHYGLAKDFIYLE